MSELVGFRVTKYDPQLRAPDGSFEGHEWTSVSDIGRVFASGRLTLERYLETERAYVETVHRFLAAANVKSWWVEDLEVHGGPCGLPADTVDDPSRAALDWVVRSALREEIWCRLRAEGGAYVHFGYDYYMYLGVDRDDFVLPELPPGMYAEPFESPYRKDE